MTRSTRMDVGYFGRAPEAPGDNYINRTAQRAASKRRTMMIAATVGELIDLLKKVDPASRVYTIEPPFNGVKLSKQGDGTILICRTQPQTKGVAKLTM